MTASRQPVRMFSLMSRNLVACFIAFVLISTTVYFKITSDRAAKEATRLRVHQYEKMLKKFNVVAKKTGMAPVDDQRPEQCLVEFSQGLRPDLSAIASRHPELKVSIVILPTAGFESFTTALSRVILTTNHFHSNLEIAVISEEKDAKNFKETFQDLKARLSLRVIVSKQKATLFKEMLELTEQFPTTDIVVMMITDVIPTVGWLEALIQPIILKDRDSAPLIVAPYVDNSDKQELSIGQLGFNRDLVPKWMKSKKTRAEEVPTLAFLPDMFAINRQSQSYKKLVDFINSSNLLDATSLDASMFAWRCLGKAVLMAPCSRVGSYELPSDFDLSMTVETKKRVSDLWFRTEVLNSGKIDMFAKYTNITVDLNPTLVSTVDSCKSLKQVAAEIGANELLF